MSRASLREGEPTAVVLTGRSSGTQLAWPTVAADGAALVDIPAADFRVFGPEVVDVWVEEAVEGGEGVRRRVGCPDTSEYLRDASVPGARWYVTAKGNLSVEVAPPVGGAYTRPTLVAVTTAVDGWEVVVEGIGTHVEPRLVAQGRRTGIAVDFPLARGALQWAASVGSERLKVLNGEVVDIYVAGPTAESPRARLVAGADLDQVAKTDLRTWYVTVEGNVSIRRKTAAEAIREGGAFDDAFYRAQALDLAPDDDPIEHYVTVGAAEGLNPSSMFDTNYYIRSNPSIRRANPFAHYCEYGWKELRDPSPRFDTWWYWSKHLDLGSERVMPLAHYEEVGKDRGLSTRPERFPSRRLSTGHRLTAGHGVRRVCLFAAYDADGVVDDYVVDYVRELARFADVYYLADSAEMSESELAKLSDITVGAWAERHGEHDFGSYKRLAERVGWEVLETYDEMLLVNDSCYLLRPLDEVFERMDKCATDWWGLQAGTRRHTSEDPHRLPMEHASLEMLIDRVESRQSDYLHVSSYFTVYRQPVLCDPEFRRYLSSVSRQLDLSTVALKYEVGLSRWLVNHGHRFDTFIQDIYPYHPALSGWYFRLLDQGFPLLKRQLLSANPFGVKNLAGWKDRILAKVPDAKVDQFERNLHRVVDAATLDATLGRDPLAREPANEELPSVLLSHDDFRRADRRLAKDAALWVFPVDPHAQEFTGSGRAIFEEVKHEPSIRKAVLYRDNAIGLDGVNVETVALKSPEGQACVLRAGSILVSGELASALPFPVSGEFHNLVHLGSADPAKLLQVADRAPVTGNTSEAQYRAIVSSSKVETLALTAASYPLTFHQVWNTGLPRTDFILMAEDDLPPDMVAELARLRGLIAGRKLLLWTSVREIADDALRVDVLPWLRSWLLENDFVLGLRHGDASVPSQVAQLDGAPAIDLSASQFSHAEVLYREAAALVSDFSSSFVDFLVTGRPVVGLVHEGAAVRDQDASDDLEAMFPGPVARTSEELRSALAGLPASVSDGTYEFKRRLFHDHFDGASAARVAERIRDLTEVYGVGKRFGERMA